MSRILVVEDNAEARNLLAITFAEDGHEVAIRHDAREGLEAVKKISGFQLIVLDGLNGEVVPLLEQIRQLGITCAIVIWTALATPEIRAAAERHRAEIVLKASDGDLQRLRDYAHEPELMTPPSRRFLTQEQRTVIALLVNGLTPRWTLRKLEERWKANDQVLERLLGELIEEHFHQHGWECACVRFAAEQYPPLEVALKALRERQWQGLRKEDIPF